MDLVQKEKIIACVTGGSGIVGRRIVNLLQKTGYCVKVLTRKKGYDIKNVEIINGNLEDEEKINIFLSNASLLFHCAGETRDESKMWEVNVNGTRRLIRKVADSNIKYFCYISSAGVVGKTYLKTVDEKTGCAPQNTYETSKWEAEKLVASGIPGCQIVILRPTNVIDDDHPGALSLPMRSAFSDYLKVFLKGGECAHIVHAEDVAYAALSLISFGNNAPSCFFVSYDHEKLNTFSELWSLYKALEKKITDRKIKPAFHLHMYVPYILRKLYRKKGNVGNVRYSSAKLLSTGFYYRVGVEGAIRRITSSRQSIK
jgi:nucleoside-diphosphate-sugar epimerase